MFVKDRYFLNRNMDQQLAITTWKQTMAW